MTLLSKMNIGIRLGISFAIITVFLLLIVMVSLHRINDLTEANKTFVDKELAGLSLVSSIKSEANSAVIKLLILLSTEDRDLRIPLYKEMDAHNRVLNEQLEELNLKHKPSGFEGIMAARNRYYDAFMETVEYLELDPDTVLEQFSSTTRPALEQFLWTIDELVTGMQNTLQQEHQIALKESKKASAIVINIALCVLILSILLAFIVSRSITSPISEAVQAAKAIAKGDLRSTPTVKGRDEIAELMQSFIIMSQGLKHLIGSIQGSTKNVTGFSNDLTTLTNKVTQGSKGQSESVHRIEELVVAFLDETRHVAATADEAKAQSDAARLLAEEGQVLINKATKEFKKISSTISRSAHAVETLSERAVSVRILVTTVKEIADQTNLLALNAAIEAARAGEFGRGFSVVADEVRGLAIRTAQATSEINNVIDAMDSETQIAVEQITNGKVELEHGVTTIQGMVAPLENLNKGAHASHAELERLDDIVNKQAHESAEIQKNISDIGHSADQNLNVAHQVCNTTVELAETAKQLNEEALKFSIE